MTESGGVQGYAPAFPKPHSLRHLDGDAEEAVAGLAAGGDFAPRRVGQALLAPHAVGAHTLADAIAVERGRPR